MSTTKPAIKPEGPMPASSTAQQGDNIAHALAGAGGGLLSMTLTSVPHLHTCHPMQNLLLIKKGRYPLITLSTRAQVESKRAQSSTYDAVRRIVQREGITGLYSGLDSALFGISVTNFVYYYCQWIMLHQIRLANAPDPCRVRMDARGLRARCCQSRSRIKEAYNNRVYDCRRHCRLSYSPYNESNLGG